MSFDSTELTEALRENYNYENVIDEFGHLMIDGVEDYHELFDRLSEHAGYNNFQIQIESRPSTAYVHQPFDEPEDVR